ncbi:MAG: MBL fold metallo-hydrolase, partial [Lachnospiraceae bacterium]|nr:MBL fold metallo-hydrolase [Lachnospiraceae bacterium]
IDPFQMDGVPHDAAIVLVTHDHYDHFSKEDIEKVCCRDTVLVVPEKMAVKANDVSAHVKEIKTVVPGKHYEVKGLEFETVVAYNVDKPFHPKNAGWVGYVLITDGQRIYIAGDTDATREAESVKCDIALVPVGGTYTMDAKQAAGLVNTIRPKIAIPVHYGSAVGKPSDGADFARLVKGDVKVEIKIG